MSNLIALLERGMASAFISNHGALDKSQMLQMPRLAQTDSVHIDVDGDNYRLSNADYQQAILRLRQSLIFPSTFYCHLPYLEFADPQIHPNQFDLKIDPEQHKVGRQDAFHNCITIPSHHCPYDAENQCFLLKITLAGAGWNIPVDAALHRHFQQGLKISVWFDAQGQLHWLPSHLAVAYWNYQQAKQVFEISKQKVNHYYQLSLALKPLDKTQLLNRLPFDCLPVYKVNRRMLHAQGWGNGTKRNTLTHLGQVRGGFTAHTDLGQCASSTDLLCGQNSRHDHAPSLDSIRHSAATWQALGITCKACIAAAKKLMLEPATLH